MLYHYQTNKLYFFNKRYIINAFSAVQLDTHID